MFEKKTNTILKNWKVKVFVDDSLCMGISSSDGKGLILIDKVKNGKRNIVIRPEKYRDERFDMETLEGKPVYFTIEVRSTRDRKEKQIEKKE